MSLRLVRFASVGMLCLLIQLLFLYTLERYIHPTIANGIGFIASAQLNFILSYKFTWHDSMRQKGFLLTATWFRFNLVVLFSACVNAAMFSLIRFILIDLNIWSITSGLINTSSFSSNIVAAIGATVFSTACTFLINHFHVLKPERVDNVYSNRHSNVPASVE